MADIRDLFDDTDTKSEDDTDTKSEDDTNTVSEDETDTVPEDSVPEASPVKLTPELDEWMQKDPDRRREDAEYLMKHATETTVCKLTESGELHYTITFPMANWTFLLVLDPAFPDGDVPVKAYPVIPSAEELESDPAAAPYLRTDNWGVKYLLFDDAWTDTDDDSGLCICNIVILDMLLTKTLSDMASGKMHRIRRNHRKNSLPFRVRRKTDAKQRPKYTNGIKNPDRLSPKCKKVVLSDRAFVQIVNESQSKIETETGGLFLGHYDDGNWYVVEASDPGINGVFEEAYHEADEDYQNHVCSVISRTYKYPLRFLGMWHRHPGSLDRFSSVDDRTNYTYAGETGRGCISMLINYDPDLRLTCYFAEQDENDRVYYTRVPLEVGDEYIPRKEIFEMKSMTELKSAINNAPTDGE